MPYICSSSLHKTKSLIAPALDIFSSLASTGVRRINLCWNTLFLSNRYLCAIWFKLPHAFESLPYTASLAHMPIHLLLYYTLSTLERSLSGERTAGTGNKLTHRRQFLNEIVLLHIITSTILHIRCNFPLSCWLQKDIKDPNILERGVIIITEPTAKVCKGEMGKAIYLFKIWTLILANSGKLSFRQH